MGVAEFWTDDDAYLRWVTEHADGFVINIQRSLNPGDARIHRASCHSIRGRPPRGDGFAGAYIKICCESLAELSQWARNRVHYHRAPLPPLRAAGPGPRAASRSTRSLTRDLGSEILARRQLPALLSL